MTFIYAGMSLFVVVVTAAVIGLRKSRNGLTYLRKRHRWEFIGS